MDNEKGGDTYKVKLVMRKELRWREKAEWKAFTQICMEIGRQRIAKLPGLDWDKKDK